MKKWPQDFSGLAMSGGGASLVNFPKLTIITPSYNQGRFIEETILSVLNQNYPNIEYIIIDGGSTDNTVEIIKKYEHKLAYWVSEEDRGQAHAVNKGLEKATGEIIGWINSDDIYLPWTFSEVMKRFSEKPDVHLIWGSRILIDAKSQILGFAPAQAFVPESYFFTINSETAFWRSSIHKTIPRLDENLHFAMDLDFFGQIWMQYPSGFMPEWLGCFRCYPENKSSTMQDVCLANMNVVYPRVLKMPYRVPDNKNKSSKAFFLFRSWRIFKHPLIILIPALAGRVRRFLKL